MRFCTVINCMDGRVQLPVIEYLQKRFGVDCVDSITEAGPNLILAKQHNPVLVDSILERLKISIERHRSVGVAVVGHQDCAGNPAPRDEQIKHIEKAVQFIRSRHANQRVIGLWVGNNWQVREVVDDGECDDI